MLYKCLQQQNLVQFLCKRRQIPPIPCSPERAARARTPRVKKSCVLQQPPLAVIPRSALGPASIGDACRHATRDLLSPRATFHKLSSASFISFQSSSSGSQPTESRTNPSGTLSPQRARLSAEECTPPKLVVGLMNLQPLMNFSAELLSFNVTPIIMAKRSIWLSATSCPGCDASPGNLTCRTLRCSSRRPASASALLHIRSKRTSNVSSPR